MPRGDFVSSGHKPDSESSSAELENRPTLHGQFQNRVSEAGPEDGIGMEWRRKAAIPHRHQLTEPAVWECACP
jgi:hypothetical protein